MLWIVYHCLFLYAFFFMERGTRCPTSGIIPEGAQDTTLLNTISLILYMASFSLLIYIFPMISDADHFFIYFLICISYLKKSLFISAPCISGLVDFFLVNFYSILCLSQINFFNRWMVKNIFSSRYGVFFYSGHFLWGSEVYLISFQLFVFTSISWPVKLSHWKYPRFNLWSFL